MLGLKFNKRVPEVNKNPSNCHGNIINEIDLTVFSSGQIHPVECGMKLLIHSQAASVALLKIANGNFIPHFTMNVITYPCWVLNVIHVSKTGPSCVTSVLFQYLLTHWGWEKIAAISQRTFSNAFSWKYMHFISVSLKIVPKVSIHNIPAFGSDNGSVLTRQQAINGTNDGYFTDAYMRCSASMS